MKIVLLLLTIINLFIGFHGKIDTFNILSAGVTLGVLLTLSINSFFDTLGEWR